jgi:hypothetical protein
MDVSQLLRALGLEQAYGAYQRNIGEPFAAIAGGIGRGYLGLDKPQYGGLLAEDMYRTGQALGSMPGIGAPAGAFSVGAKAAAQVPSLLADAVQMMKANPEAGLLALTGYHGSPHRFSKFDASKIGSGEGAQAYGHGLYFAESPGVAKEYRDKLSTNVTVDNKKLQTIPSDSPMAEAHNMIVRNMQTGMSATEAIAATNKYWIDAADEMLGFAESNPGLVERIRKEAASRMEVANVAKSLKPEIFYRDPGSFYTVDIPDEMIGKMIDWDKPLNQQPKFVQNALNKLPDDVKKHIGIGKYDDLKGGADILQPLGGLIGDKEAANMLRQAGIPGVRYLDQGSRGSGKGTSNFVVFPGEEEAVRILNVE